jgi:hypothetical protein
MFNFLPRRRSAAVLAAAFVAVVVPPTAMAGYWTWQTWLSPDEYVGYVHGPQVDEEWYFRQSRSNCNAKMSLHNPGGSWMQVNILGGCAVSDYDFTYFTQDFDGSRSINKGSSNVYVNVRIQPN